MKGTRAGPPWRLLAALAAVLYLLLPVRLAYGRFVAIEATSARVRANTGVVTDRTDAAHEADGPALRSNLQSIEAAMPPGGLDSWITAVSGLARVTGTTWTSGTVSPSTADEHTSATAITIVVDGAPAGVLAFVDQLRLPPLRLTLVDAFAMTTDAKDGRRASATLRVRVLSFVPTDPAPPARV